MVSLKSPAGLLATALILSGLAGAATCDLSYLPLGKASFQVTAGEQKATFTTVSRVSGNGASGEANIGINYRWDCVGKDVRNLIKMNGQTIKLTQGTYMPAANLWKVGYTWNTTGIAFKDSAPKQTVTVTSTNRIAAREKLTVPAGTFDTYRVEAEAKLAGNSSKMTFWYAQGYGMVKQIDHSTGAQTVMTKFVK